LEEAEMTREKLSGKARVLFLLLVMITGLFLVVPASAKVSNLKIQCFTAGEEMERLMQVYIPLVEKLTEGTVKIKEFPVGALVPLKEVLNALRSGVIEMALVPEGYFAGAIPVCEVAGGLPYAFRSYEEAAFFMWNRGFVEILQREYAKQNVHMIPLEVYGAGLMTKEPIKHIEELKGKKIRAFGPLAEWLRECGASTVFIPGGEVYTALATGVVDGATWGDAGPMYEFKIHEVLKSYMLPDPILGAWLSILINKDVWDKFSPEQRIAIKAATLAAGNIIYNHTRVIYARALVDMVKNWRVQKTVLSEEEQEKAKELAMKSWDRIAKKDPLNAKVIDMIKAFLGEREVVAKITLPYPW
jgi:TRAP-type C4-dicarboxylate transport system substrate-binding protein